MYFLIYRITNLVNGRIYIGQHKTDNINDGYMGSGKLIRRAIEKHGIDNFSREILFSLNTEAEMNSKEAELVTEEFCSHENTYNIMPGGFGGFSYINENGLKPIRKGEYNGMFGKNHSKETKEKISEARLGKKNPKQGKSLRKYWQENPDKHHKLSDEEKIKLKKANHHPVTDGIRIFNSRKECAAFHGFKHDCYVNFRVNNPKYPDWKYLPADQGKFA